MATARAIVENAFFNSFFQKQLMVGVGETVRFIANPLQQTQRAGVERKSQRKRTSWPENLFVLFRQTDDWQIVQAESLQLATRGRELPFAAIDDDQIGNANVARASGLRINFGCKLDAYATLLSFDCLAHRFLRKLRRIRIELTGL